jgi:hypothetical protein
VNKNVKYMWKYNAKRMRNKCGGTHVFQMFVNFVHILRRNAFFHMFSNVSIFPHFSHIAAEHIFSHLFHMFSVFVSHLNYVSRFPALHRFEHCSTTSPP